MRNAGKEKVFLRRGSEYSGFQPVQQKICCHGDGNGDGSIDCNKNNFPEDVPPMFTVFCFYIMSIFCNSKVVNVAFVEFKYFLS